MKQELYAAITAWSALAAVGAALTAVWLQNRSSRRLACLQLFAHLARQYESPQMQGLRRRLATQLMSEPRTVELDDTLFVFYENLGVLTRRGLLDPELIWNIFVFDVVHYWVATKHYVRHMRDVSGDESIYEEFERLAERLSYQRHSPLGRLRPESVTSAQLLAFLQMESRRGT